MISSPELIALMATLRADYSTLANDKLDRTGD
jgi:hypothetical protein